MTIRRKRLTAKQRQRQAFRQRQPLSIGETRRKQKAKRDAAEKAYRSFVRQQLVVRVLKNPYGAIRCEGCNGAQRSVDDLEMHECVPRARTRRMPPEVRYDRRWCVLVCHSCHVGFTDHELSIAFESIVRGADGQRAVNASATGLASWGATAEEVWNYALAQRKRQAAV